MSWTIKLVSGSGYTAPLTFLQENDAPVNLTGADIRFRVKKADGSEIIWSTTNGKVPPVGAASLGTAQLLLTPTDVAAIDQEFSDYDWEIIWADNTREELGSNKVWKE